MDVAAQDAAGNVIGTLSGPAFGAATITGGQVGPGKAGA
jgi:hypothetical protein